MHPVTSVISAIFPSAMCGASVLVFSGFHTRVEGSGCCNLLRVSLWAYLLGCFFL
uniref:Uncharacterized protein n=1 Tax=Manihot esculenta TaxID=3983 RepID=A0A2C9U0G3_MANES